MVVLVSITVVLRYVFRTGITWSEEFVRYAYVWLIFLGSVTAIKLNAHIGLELVVERLPLKIRIIVQCLGDLLVMGFVVVQTVYGFSLILKAGGALSAVTRIPMGWIYVVFPLSGVLMMIEMVHVLRKHWNMGKEYKDETGYIAFNPFPYFPCDGHSDRFCNRPFLCHHTHIGRNPTVACYPTAIHGERLFHFDGSTFFYPCRCFDGHRRDHKQIGRIRTMLGGPRNGGVVICDDCRRDDS